MKHLLFIINLTCFSLETLGQHSPIDKKDLKYFVRVLASDSLEGRGTGTVGQKRAAIFISERFRKLGLQTFDQNGYLQKFRLNREYWGQVYMKTQNSILKNFETMIFQGNDVQNEEIEKEIVFGGSGTEAELNQIDVKGRLVLLFVKNLRSTGNINHSLSKRDASGLIIANPADESQFESIKKTLKNHALQKRFFLTNADTTNSISKLLDLQKLITTIIIPNSHIKDAIGLSQRTLTKLITEGKINEAPISKVKIKLERIREEIETSNVIGTIKGTTDKTIVISAHYDHLGKNENNYFPGADDNASGTAALMELAEEFSSKKDLKFNIMFLATSAEENGLLGSLYHTKTSSFIPGNIICNLNIDMISRMDEHHNKKDYLYCIGTDQSKELHSLFKKAEELYEDCSFDYSLDNSKDLSGLFMRSDSYNFYKKGILSIHFLSGLHPDYHKETDTMEKIDFENLEKRVRLIGTVIDLLEKGELHN